MATVDSKQNEASATLEFVPDFRTQLLAALLHEHRGDSIALFYLTATER